MHSGREHWRLGHRPALDGLRGVAVLLVLAGHALVPWLKDAGGQAGVTMFFTLSGFLITTLLLNDIDRGRIRIKRFYTNRALRLLPAALIFLAVIGILGVIFHPDAVHRRTWVGSIFYVSNYVLRGGGHDWLGHMWSLAIEEQFYLLWPFLLLGLTRLTRKPLILGLVIGELALASAVARFAIWNDDGTATWRIYYGLDTRADALLIGALVAVLIRTVAIEKARPWATIPAATLVAFACTWTDAAMVVKVMPFVVAVATAVILWAVAQGSGFAPFQARWLTWTGRRSYGLYLWHYPVCVILIDHLEWTWWARLPIILAISLALTVLSWRLVEVRFLRMKARLGDAEEIEVRLDTAQSDLLAARNAHHGRREAWV